METYRQSISVVWDDRVTRKGHTPQLFERQIDQLAREFLSYGEVEISFHTHSNSRDISAWSQRGFIQVSWSVAETRVIADDDWSMFLFALKKDYGLEIDLRRLDGCGAAF